MGLTGVDEGLNSRQHLQNIWLTSSVIMLEGRIALDPSRKACFASRTAFHFTNLPSNGILEYQRQLVTTNQMQAPDQIQITLLFHHLSMFQVIKLGHIVILCRQASVQTNLIGLSQSVNVNMKGSPLKQACQFS